MSLITPGPKSSVRVGNKYIQQSLDWLDNLIGGGEVREYTPIFSSTGGTPPNLGNGSITGTWYRFFNLVHASIIVTWGTESNQGDGRNWFTISLPVPMQGLTSAFESGYSNVIGSGFARSESTGVIMPITVGLFNEDSLLFHTRQGATGGRGLRHGIPWDWEAGDIISITCEYTGGF